MTKSRDNQGDKWRRILTKKHHHNTESDIFIGLSRNNLDEATHLAEDTVIAEATHKALTDKEKMIEQGRMYLKLMVDASRAADLPEDLALNKIQFNFCVKGLATKKDEIEKAIEMYLTHSFKEDRRFNSHEKSKINNIERPFKLLSTPDATRLHEYTDTLYLRGKSFYEAAKMIVDHTQVKNNDILNDNLKSLFTAYESHIQSTQVKSEQQAYYDAFINALKDFLQVNIYPDMKDKEVLKYLKSAETINNIKEKNCHITFSGDLTNPKMLEGNISVQMDQPLTQFKYLSKEQQQAWIEAIQKYQTNPQDKKIPVWFKRLPDFEKNVWINRLMDSNGKPNMDAHMCPVVKKEGIPGLRNLALSSFATMTYEKGAVSKKSISNKSVRSSNLVVQNKEKTSELSEGEKALTAMNIEQVNHIYDMMKDKNKNNAQERQSKEEDFTTIWGAHYPQYVLYQTLLRVKGGGDDYVIGHKNEAIEKTKNNSYITLHQSNHCIGSPHDLAHGIMHLAGANTKTMDHVSEPVNDFINRIVGKAFASELKIKNISDDATKKTVLNVMNPLLEAAKKGSFTIEMFKDAISNSPTLKNYTVSDDTLTSHIRTKQMDGLKRVLLSLNMYAQIHQKPTSYKKNYQLHMAALEELIYQDTGNRMQSSCKSGKDREGVAKTYRNAMIKYFNLYDGQLPPPKENAEGDRKKFINIFIELFITNHQARLAELNASGCQGLKSLVNVLPKDIKMAVKEDERIQQLLGMHKDNSALNTMGQSNVKADAGTYQSAKEAYSKLIEGAMLNQNADKKNASITSHH